VPFAKAIDATIREGGSVMKVISTSAVLGAAALAALVVFTINAGAQGPNKCLAGKSKCVSKKMKGLLKCHEKAEKTGGNVDPICTGKVTDKFDGGAVPADGCFEKLETKNDGPCVTSDDTSPLENKVDAFVLDVVTELDPSYPTPVLNGCSAGKKKCVAKKAAALLKCHEKAVKVGSPLLADPACLQKAMDKFDGGINPAKGCFEKLETKFQANCATFDDTSTMEAKVDAFVTDVLCELGYTTLACGPPPTPTPSLSPTPTATPTCAPAPILAGSLVPTLGRFNYNAMIGLPAANSACNSNFAGSHPCTYFELQCAQAAGELVGLTDTASNPVNSLWAIDHSAPPLKQCQDDVGSFLNWEYGTGHTGSRGQRVALNNLAGTLGPLQSNVACFLGGSGSNVGCCQ
jgi:hypothetical protein